MEPVFNQLVRLTVWLCLLGVFGLHPVEAQSKVRFFYATLPEGDASAGLWVHAHFTQLPKGVATMAFRQRGQSNWNETVIQPIPLKFGTQQRWLFRHFLALNPDQNYEVSVRLNGQDAGSLSLRSLPASGQPLRFVDGGDSTTGGAAGQLFAVAAQRSPHFSVMGGDYAYEDGQPAAFWKFDEWLQLWCTRMITPPGNSVPLLPVLGNHEVQGGWGQTPAQATFWLPYFNLGQPRTYAFRNLGGFLGLWSLDSGHAAPMRGEQSRWMESSFSQNSQLPWRLASYHVPLYPCSRDFADPHSLDARQAWLGLFDRHQLTLALEHHEHAFKRTHPLRGGRVEEGGTVYLGDGCWGQQVRSVQPSRKYLAKTLSCRHFWLIEADPTQLKATAIDAKGNEFDRIEMSAQ